MPESSSTHQTLVICHDCEFKTSGDLAKNEAIAHCLEKKHSVHAQTVQNDYYFPWTATLEAPRKHTPIPLKKRKPKPKTPAKKP